MKTKVTCALIEQHGRVLITQRSDTMPQPLLWEFPGGKIEAGETEQECLIREIKEELNLTVTPLQRLTPVEFVTDGKTLELIPYICQYDHGAIHLAEHRAYQWVIPADFHLHTWCAADLPVMEEYLRLISQ